MLYERSHPYGTTLMAPFLGFAKCGVAEMDTWRVQLLPSANISKPRRDSDWTREEERKNKEMRCEKNTSQNAIEVNEQSVKVSDDADPPCD